MDPFTLAEREPIRLAALRRLRLLDTPDEERFDRLTRLARRLFGVPSAGLALVDEARIWFKSLQGPGPREIARGEASIEELMRRGEPVVVASPAFFAAYPLRANGGTLLGFLGLWSETPREFGDQAMADLRDLASVVSDELHGGVAVKLSREALRCPHGHRCQTPGKAEATQDDACALRDFTSAVVDHVGSLVIILDPHGRIVRFNVGCEETTGYTFAEVQGRPIWDLLLAPEERDNVVQVFESLAAGNFPNQHENDWVSRSGERRRIAWSNTALLAADGSVAYVVGNGQDITEKLAAADALHAGEMRYRALFEHALDAILLTSAQGVILAANPAAGTTFGYDPADLLAMRIHEVVAEDAEVLEEAFEAHRSQGKFRGTLTFRRQDGDRFPGEISTSSFHATDGARQISVVIRDITTRLSAERAKDEFIAVVSHEMRTPLTSIQGSLQLLSHLNLGPLPDQAEDMLAIALHSTERLVRLTNDILDAESLRLGRSVLEKIACDAAELMWEAGETVQAMAAHAQVVLNIEPFPCTIVADPRRMGQVLTNLLANAIKFSRPGGTVSLEASLRGPDLVFRLQDQGRGIPADKLESVFERFAQVDASDARDKGGTGLGLAICRSIVQQHRGQVWVESTLGVGSTFFVSLPLSPDLSGTLASERRVLDPDHNESP